MTMTSQPCTLLTIGLVLLLAMIVDQVSAAEYNIALGYDLAVAGVLCTPAERQEIADISHECSADAIDSSILTASGWQSSDEEDLAPTAAPSDVPSQVPSQAPSQMPSQLPSPVPSYVPSQLPTIGPSQAPSDSPSKAPSPAPGGRRRVLMKEMADIFADPFRRRLNCACWSLCLSGATSYCECCSCCTDGRRLRVQDERRLSNTVSQIKNCAQALVLSKTELTCVDEASITVLVQAV